MKRPPKSIRFLPLMYRKWPGNTWFFMRWDKGLSNGGCGELRSLSPVQAVCVIQRWEDHRLTRKAFYHCSSELEATSARGRVSGSPGLLGPEWVTFREPDKLRGSLPGMTVGLMCSSPSSRSLISRPVMWFPHPFIFVPSSKNERRRKLGPHAREK